MRPRTVSDRLAKIDDWPQRAEASDYHAWKLACMLGVKPQTLRRFFHHKFGQPVQQQLNQFRQLKAEALAKKGLPLKVIAGELGFKQVSQLSSQFKKSHGISFLGWLEMLG